MSTITKNILLNNESPMTPVKEDAKNEKPYKKRLHQIGIIALKGLAISGMVIGVALAIGGGVALTKIAIISGAVAPMFAIGALFGKAMLEISIECLMTPAAPLVLFTLPVAGISFALPFVLPFTVGALPGMGLIALSTWGWEALNKKD